MNLVRFGLRLLLGQRLPTVVGDLSVPGLVGPVVIRRDQFGVPHIEAESDADAWFGLGFCHGQDRAFQLETLLRLARGTLAELLGREALGVDRVSRRVGFYRAAQKQIAVQHADALAVMTAYANGVSMGATRGMAKPAHEFALLKSEPTSWTARDVLAVLNLQSFLLPSNWDVELARLKILLADGPEAVRELDPTTLSGVSSKRRLTDDELSEPVDQLLADLANLERFRPTGGGSNNWAIAGSRTLSGKPLLANDPHLPPTAPPPWYLAHVVTPNWSVAGASLAGAPGIPVGHNGFACWGLTAGLTDTTDLFVETAEADGTFAASEAVREIIRVKGEADVVEEVIITRHGPIVTPTLGKVAVALSLRSVWLEPHPIRGLLDIAKARDFETFRKSFAEWPALPQNLLYADSEGTIGYQLIGQLPERGSPSSLLPREESASPPAAAGGLWPLIPFDKMPFEINPECGYLATANTSPPGDLDMGHDFCEPFRFEVIRDELARTPVGWRVVDCLQLQQSVRSKPWEMIREVVLALHPSGDDNRLSLQLLREWDGHVRADSPAATIYELFVASLCVRIAKSKAPKSWRTAIGGGGEGPFSHNTFGERRMSHLIRLLRTQPPGWFERAWSAELLDVLSEVVKHLRKHHGPGPRWWHWGDVRPLQPRHPLFGRHWLLGRAFNLPTLFVGGDTNTPNQAACRPGEPFANPHMVPTLRTVFDTADWANCRFALCGGQSGNPLSQHFADQLPIWLRGEGISIPLEPVEILRQTASALRLTPG